MPVWVWLACAKPDEKPGPRPDPTEESSGTTVERPAPRPDPTETTFQVEPVDLDEVCYLGPDRTFDVCLPIAGLDATPPDYEYPDPLYGSDQYLAPQRYLWLEEVDGETELAPNFQLLEIAVPQKGPWGVVQPHAIASLQAVRDEVGVLNVNSGYRSPAYNATVGGATWSRHMYGDAFDLDPGSATLIELAEACEGNGAGYVGVYETHIHCDWRDDPVDSSFFGTGGSVARAAAPRPVVAAELVQADGWCTAPAEGWDEGEPLRVWRAFDAAGAQLEEWVGREYLAPEGAARVEVEVGREVTISREAR